MILVISKHTAELKFNLAHQMHNQKQFKLAKLVNKLYYNSMNKHYSMVTIAYCSLNTIESMLLSQYYSILFDLRQIGCYTIHLYNRRWICAFFMWKNIFKQKQLFCSIFFQISSSWVKRHYTAVRFFKASTSVRLFWCSFKSPIPLWKFVYLLCFRWVTECSISFYQGISLIQWWFKNVEQADQWPWSSVKFNLTRFWQFSRVLNQLKNSSVSKKFWNQNGLQQQ